MWWKEEKKYFRLDSLDLVEVDLKRDENNRVFPKKEKKSDKRSFNFGLNPLIKRLSYHNLKMKGKF